ncbi:Eukaryotic translation initiation factor 3 subunit A [Cyphellophora attinorum]|uniref:Eukaryotic translation initiation factor 3 subunit A n=1 Tax=Cyphellophora attinorum TaxID=1664694 RepID=A0A0N0NRP7_9EURO|nr:Eukaryotic translation initiation factor 3 subunit A [Phialophora attinorum]KPI45341.1 Eukaryotic translation initiation factor 3 subunit A [Phialophora attinorum]
MPPPPMIKPENILKRAEELQAVNQPLTALNVLHEHLTNKRSRNAPIVSLEPAIIKLVQLAVELKKGKIAKDASINRPHRIHQSRREESPGAQAKSLEVQATFDTAPTDSLGKIEDLEALETPETILLATVSGEQSKDRTDRAIVTPWLKFLWETYRTVLDILKNNARVEILYQQTAHQAFDFCLKYTRKTEFRRLCELLRNHVQNAAKYSSQMHAINLNEPDTLQRHLETRFRQLNCADELELWQEAFRSIEDIHQLLTLSKRPAKNTMMANYFEKLTKIFLVSDDYLFHAAAYNKYYTLLRTSQAAVAAGQSPKKDNPVVTDAQLTKVASFVLLSALAIPVISTSRSRGLVDVDEARKKTTRLTNLLNMPASPTRASLFKDAQTKGLLKKAAPEIRELYDILEKEFHPLSICKKISPILARIGNDPEMVVYVQPLQQVILTRLFQQLSQVYESVELKFVFQLAQFPEPFQVNPATIEKFIMNGCKKGDLAIRLDHVSGTLNFDQDVYSSAKAVAAGDDSSVQRLQHTPTEIVRTQLERLAKTLFVTCKFVDPSFNQARLAARESALARAQAGAEQERTDTLQRRAIIERKKEAASEALSRKQREEETRRRVRAQQQAEAESQRLRDEQKARELKRVRDEQTRIRRQEMEKQLQELKGSMKIDLEDVNIDDLDSNAVRMLKLTQLEKDKRDKDVKVGVTAKRIDHLERAFRREEVKHLDEDYNAQKEADLKAYEEEKAQKLKDSKEEHERLVELKNRLTRLVGPYDEFKSSITKSRAAEFEKSRRKAEQEFEAEKRKRVKAHYQEKARLRQQQEEEEARRREEEDRLAREAEQKAAEEEEKERQRAERRAKAEAERAEREEAARKQMQREEEAAARRAERKNQIPDRTAPPVRDFGSVRREAAPMESRTDSNERALGGAGGPPRLNLAGRAGGGGGWRERQAAKEAAGAGGAPAPSDRAPPVQEPSAPRSGYVPPHLRGAAGAAGAGAGSGAGSGGDVPPRKESPANGDAAPPRGRYVPPSMRNR